MPKLIEDRFVDPDDVEVEKMGFFAGYGKPQDGYFDYEYASYRDGKTAVEMFPDIAVAVLGPIFPLMHAKFFAEMLQKVEEFEWGDKPDIYMAECHDTPLFISNHIPKPFDGYKTNFKMIADHSQCTADHCFGEDEDDSTPE